MIFFLGNSETKKLRNKFKKKQYEAFCRRVHMIHEAQKSHERNRKEIQKSKGGWGYTASMEEEDLGFAVAEGINKVMGISSGAVSRIVARQKSLNKSRGKHLSKLKESRAKALKRQR